MSSRCSTGSSNRKHSRLRGACRLTVEYEGDKFGDLVEAGFSSSASQEHRSASGDGSGDMALTDILIVGVKVLSRIEIWIISRTPEGKACVDERVQHQSCDPRGPSRHREQPG